jgi:hypothetical protein
VLEIAIGGKENNSLFTSSMFKLALSLLEISKPFYTTRPNKHSPSVVGVLVDIENLPILSSENSVGALDDTRNQIWCNKKDYVPREDAFGQSCINTLASVMKHNEENSKGALPVPTITTSYSSLKSPMVTT